MASIPTSAEIRSYPPPRVRDAMTFGGLVQAKLVGGSAGLDREVAWVRVMETPETVNFLRPGDLMVTTGFAVKDDRDAQVRLVAQVAGAGGAGIVIKPARYLHGLPAEMVAEAERLSLPLFTIEDEVGIVEVMEPLLERIINAEHWRLKHSLEIHRRFTELVLDGKGMSEVGRTLADLLAAAVSVEDASFHLLSHAGGSANDPHRKETIARHGTPARVQFDPQIQAMLRELEHNRRPAKVGPFPHVGMSKERIIAPILAAGQVLGYISVIDSPAETDELAFMAVEQAALVMALAMTKERELAEVETQVRGEFLDELMQGTFGDEASAQRRARHLGYPIAGQHVLVEVDIDDFSSVLKARQAGEDAIQALKREYFRRVSGVIRSSHPKALMAAHSDTVAALLPVGSAGDAADLQRRCQALGRHVQEAVAAWRPGFTVSVGISGAVDAPAGIAAAHREVSSVLDTMARFRRWNQVVSVPELGLTGLLAGVSPDRLVEFTQRHLGALMDHDRARGSELAGTLRAYLETGEQQAAARRLSIHPNTLRYRMDRVREVTGADLDEPETRLNLAVALRVQALLGL